MVTLVLTYQPHIHRGSIFIYLRMRFIFNLVIRLSFKIICTTQCFDGRYYADYPCLQKYLKRPCVAHLLVLPKFERLRSLVIDLLSGSLLIFVVEVCPWTGFISSGMGSNRFSSSMGAFLIKLLDCCEITVCNNYKFNSITRSACCDKRSRESLMPKLTTKVSPQRLVMHLSHLFYSLGLVLCLVLNKFCLQPLRVHGIGM